MTTKPTKPTITIPASFAASGIKTDFDSDKLVNGFDHINPDVLPGDCLNKLIDDLYKASNYALTYLDYLNAKNIIFADGSINFTTEQKGVDPISSTGLTTKNYVDNNFIKKDGTVAMTAPLRFSNPTNFAGIMGAGGESVLLGGNTVYLKPPTGGSAVVQYGDGVANTIYHTGNCPAVLGRYGTYQKLSSGLIIQASELIFDVYEKTWTFPIAFPNGCVAISYINYSMDVTGNLRTKAPPFSCTTSIPLQSNIVGYGYYVMAIGY